MSAACCTGSGSATKQTLQASEQERADIREAREIWTTRRKRFFAKALPRLIFIDETSTNTRLTKRTGWSPKGERYRTHAPFGKWHTQTFIAGLRCHGMIAPWIVEAPMNARPDFAPMNFEIDFEGRATASDLTDLGRRRLVRACVQTAILAQLAGQVWSVEIIEEFARHAKDLLKALGSSNVGIRVGDGSRGWPEHSPFDKILVTAAAQAGRAPGYACGI